MAYEFHYTPTGTGVISGKEVLEQTEDAINDLGNTAISGVQEALDKAEQALTNSENAVDDAQTALNTANNAEGVAIQAQNDVSNLSGTVTNIGNRVTTAEGNITNLQGRMTTAEGNIGNLQGRMTTAEGNIGNLQTAVSTAQATANSAQQTATTARQQSYVFRYSSTALVASSTNSNTLLDNTDNLKIGDKVIDSNGVLFSITAIDSQNSTFTIGTALIDLAQDSDVVHKSGDETVGGVKTFSDNLTIYNSDSSASIPQITLKNQKVVKSSTTETGAQLIYFTDKNNNVLGQIEVRVVSNGTTGLNITSFGFDSNNQNISSGVQILRSPTTANFAPNADNAVTCGRTLARWSGVYATSYYYGNDNVEFSTKFVTTDTNQTISGKKTFSDDLTIYNFDSSQNTKNLNISSSKIQVGDTSNSDAFGIRFNAGPSYVAQILAINDTTGTQNLQLSVRTKDGLDNLITSMVRLRLFASGNSSFESSVNNTVSLGSSSNKFKDVQTYKVNGVEPSSLSLPSDRSARIDISGYFTNMSNRDTNTYTTPSNGWIYLSLNNIVAISLISQTTGGLTNYGDYRSRKEDGGLLCLFPVRKGDVFKSQWYTSSSVVITNAYFIPCQGNV